MKKVLVFTGIVMLFVLAEAGTTAGTTTIATDSGKMAAKTGRPAPNDGPNWFSVQASDLRLWVSDNGLYGGWYQDGDKGLLFHISTPRDPDRKSGSYALHSNPTNDGGYYGNQWNHWAAMPEGKLIPPGSTTASVTYWAHWNIEINRDGVELQIATSDDGYNTWTGLHPTGTVQVSNPDFPLQSGHWYYTGIYGDYGIWDQQYSCDLSSYIGKTIKLRFMLLTDTEEVSTGFFVDDLQLIANGSIIPGGIYGFEADDNNMWVTDQYWGRTVQSLWTENLLLQGEVIAGISPGYVVDFFDFDWQAFGADYGPPLHLRQTNRWTAPVGQPKFDLETFYYAPSGSGGGKYIIADCYLKNVDDTASFNALYIGMHMEPRVSIPWSDNATYDSVRKMIWLNYAGHNELTCMGMIYLAPNTGNPNAARLRDEWSSGYWGDDAQLYQVMSVAGFDTTQIEHKCYSYFSAGPYSSAQIPYCHTKRFTFAFVAGDNASQLYYNADHCRDWYDDNLANNPTIPEYPVTIEPTTLGNIKALYK